MIAEFVTYLLLKHVFEGKIKGKKIRGGWCKQELDEVCAELDTHNSLKHMLPQHCKTFNDVFY
jgi:hypothetical protein